MLWPLPATYHPLIVQRPRTWLLAKGWSQHHPLISVYEVPCNVRNWQDRWYYGHDHLYHQALTSRVRWGDERGRPVDGVGRVLTDDGTQVDKQYAVTKEGRNYVVPFKNLNPLGYLPGLPAVFGGNIDPGEDDRTAIGREIGEESGTQVVLSNLGGQRLQDQDAKNRYAVSEATVTTQYVANPQLSEMGGRFGFTASQFVGHTASPADIKPSC